MRTIRSTGAGLALGWLLLGMSSVAGASPGDFGLGVLVQPWNPITDDDEPLRVLDEPALVSDVYDWVWDTGYNLAHDLLVGWLDTGDLIMEGVTLRDIDLRIAQPKLSVRRLPGGEADSLLGVSVVFDDIHFEATSTTPDIPILDFGLGGYADPRCSVDFDLSFDVPLGVSGDVAHPLFTDITANDAAARPIARITDFRVDSQNLPCDVLVAVMSLLNIDDTLTQALQDTQRSEVREINEFLIEQYRDVLESANTAISSVVPAGYVHTKAWVRGEDETMLTLAFSAPGPFDPGPNADIEGSMLATATHIGFPAPGGTDLCTTLELHAAYKTGPRPILSPAGDLGEPPLAALPEARLLCGADDGSGNLPYRLVGLSSLLPNRVDLSSFKECNGLIESRVDVVHASGAPLGFILSPDFAQPLDLSATSSSELCAQDSPDPGRPEIPRDEDSCPMCGSIFDEWRGMPPSLPPIELPQLQLRQLQR